MPASKELYNGGKFTTELNKEAKEIRASFDKIRKCEADIEREEAEIEKRLKRVVSAGPPLSHGSLSRNRMVRNRV